MYKRQTLHGLNLDFPRGSFTALVGESGCGKSTIAAVLDVYKRQGLNLRAVGENPATADAAGINVTLYKYLSTCIGAGICGIGGLYYVCLLYTSRCV